jgi:hypothetical protein
MYSPPNIRHLIASFPWREHTPSAITSHIDRALVEIRRHEFELRNLDATFGTLAKVLVVAWVIDRWLAPGWRHVWARGVFGSIAAIFNGIKDVRYLRRPRMQIADTIVLH